jgi:Protein of unknown function (DUF1566)
MRNAICLLFVALAGLGATTGHAASPLINDTAATICYDPAGSLAQIACAGSGQDGAYGRDVTSPNSSNGAAGFRFVRVCNSGQKAGVGGCPAMPALGSAPNRWGCTLDKVSGLMWEIKTTDGSDRDMSKLFGYTDYPLIPLTGADTFAANVNAIGMCGAADWRVPTYLELLTLAHYGIAPPGPTIDPAFFPNTPNSATSSWTTTIYTFDGTYHRTVGFGSGTDGAAPGFMARYVRLVRGAPLANVQRFIPTPSGAGLKDALTGLVWRRCAEGAAWNGSACVGTPALFTWQNAMLHAAAQPGGNWRLPNIAELSTLLFDGSSNPCTLLPEPFPVLEPFWSNTPTTSGSDVWVFNHQFGACVPRAQQPMALTPGQLRLVREY